MSPNRSAPPRDPLSGRTGDSTATSARPLHPALALAATAAGVALMFGSMAVPGALPGSLRARVAAATLLLALPAAAALTVASGAARAAIGKAASRRILWLSALLAVALWVTSIGLLETQALLFPPTDEYLATFRALHQALAPKNAGDALVSLAVIAILPGLCEELVIRGALLPSLAALMRPGPAVGLSALLFALMHLDPYRFVFTLTLGVVFGLMRLWTGSLWPSVLAHAALNALTFAVAPFVDDPNAAYTPQPLLGALCLLAGLATATPLLQRLRRSSSPGLRQHD